MPSLSMEYYLPIIVMVVIEFIFAGMTLWNRVALVEGMSPRVFVVYRHALATIFLAPIAYISSRRNSLSYSLNLRSFSWIFLNSLIGITLYQNLYFEGLYLSNSSIASAMINLSPGVTFIITTFIGMEKVNIRSWRSIAKIVGTIICVSGAVSIAMLKGSKLLNVEIISTTSGSDENLLVGCLFLFGSNVSWSIWLILQVPAYASHPNYLSLSAWMCLFSTLQSTIVTLLLEQNLNSWKITSLQQFGPILFSGVMGSAVAFCLQAWCITKRGPLFSTMFSPLLTVIVTVLAALLLQEEIYTGSLIGAVGVIIGLYIVLWGKVEDVTKDKEKLDPKAIVNETKEVTCLINVSCGRVNGKTNLEQSLLADIN